MNYRMTGLLLSFALLAGCGGSGSGSSGGSGTGGGQAPTVDDDGVTAGACLGPAMQMGDTLTTRWRFDFDDGFNRSQSVDQQDYTLVSVEIFNDQEVLRFNSTVETLEILVGPPDAQLGTAESWTYRQQVAPYVIHIYGTFTNDTSVVFTPPIVRRFDLNPGESFSSAYEATTTASMLPAPSTVSIESTVTYVGRERVNVPAGSILTCRFEEVQNARNLTLDGDITTTGTWTFWWAVGSGALVKSELYIDDNPTPRERFELIAAEYNGNTIH